jgi:hypothetical protein
MRHPHPDCARAPFPTIRAWPRALAGLLLAATVLAGSAQPDAAPARPAPAQGFAFALMGDMPYGTREGDAVDRLVDAVNADAELGFVLHVGDIKSGVERCDESLLRERLRQMQRVKPALVYTPGDNEWTDCHRPPAGAYVPTERLALLRRVFFHEPGRTLGQRPMAVRSQARDGAKAHADYVENVMFERQGVLVATLHVVGSRNDQASWMGVDPTDGVLDVNPKRKAEFDARQAANLAWLDRLFGEAQRTGAAGVVVAMHGNPRIEHKPGSLERQGFDAVLEKLQARAQAFGRPVLLLHGDDHELIIDRPWSRAEPRLPNVTRVQGYGSPRIHWVKVRVRPEAPEVFFIEPQRVEGNP